MIKVYHMCGRVKQFTDVVLSGSHGSLRQVMPLRDRSAKLNLPPSLMQLSPLAGHPLPLREPILASSVLTTTMPGPSLTTIETVYHHRGSTSVAVLLRRPLCYENSLSPDRGWRSSLREHRSNKIFSPKRMLVPAASA